MTQEKLHYSGRDAIEIDELYKNERATKEKKQMTGKMWLI